MGSAGLLDISAEGTLVYESGQTVSPARPLEWVSRDGATAMLSARRLNWTNPAFSPDGKRVAMEIIDRGQSDLWLCDIGADIWTQLTFDPGNQGAPVWTPDGRRIAFASDSEKSGDANRYLMNTDGTGEATRLTESASRQLPRSWHPSGRFLAFTESPLTGRDDIMIRRWKGTSRRA